MREREMQKVTKCARVNSFVEALINMTWKLKITSGSKKICVKISWWSDIALKSYLRKTVLRGHEIHSSLITLIDILCLVNGCFMLSLIDVLCLVNWCFMLSLIIITVLCLVNWCFMLSLIAALCLFNWCFMFS